MGEGHAGAIFYFTYPVALRCSTCFMHFIELEAHSKERFLDTPLKPHHNPPDTVLAALSFPIINCTSGPRGRGGRGALGPIVRGGKGGWGPDDTPFPPRLPPNIHVWMRALCRPVGPLTPCLHTSTRPMAPSTPGLQRLQKARVAEGAREARAAKL
eukprot:1149441-Pelagomonas_calceolata.AAC.1